MPAFLKSRQSGKWLKRPVSGQTGKPDLHNPQLQRIFVVYYYHHFKSYNNEKVY